MFPSPWNLKLSSKIYSSLRNLFKFACCCLILADITVHHSQHESRQMLHLLTEIDIVAQSPSWEMSRSFICPVISIVFLD